MKVTINPSQELFVIEHTGGCSCLGFNNCFDDAAQMAGLLGTTKPDPKQKKTLDQYAEYQGLIRRYSARSDLNEQTWFDPGTPPSVVAHLEYARLHHRKLRLFFGDQTAGRCWLEENDVTGFIGRSMGPSACSYFAGLTFQQGWRRYSDQVHHPPHRGQRPARIVAPPEFQSS